MKCIVTTCGTSLLTNRATKELNDLFRETANCGENDLSQDALGAINERLLQQKKLLEGSTVQEAQNLCAELNGLIAIYAGDMADAKKDIHYLVHTDTYQGKHVADALSQWCTSRGLTSHPVLIESLNMRSIDDFRSGIGNLISWCNATLPGYRQSRYHVLFNLVGGFKSLQGYMQTLGMFYADESVYVFEGEKELIRIPRLPLDLDENSKAVMRQNVQAFRRLAWTTRPESQCKEIPETLLYCLGGECELSPWGKVLWEQYKDEIYRERLLPSPSNRLVIDNKAEKQVNSFDPPLRVRVNERLDDLARFLETGVNPRNLRFHELEGTPVTGSSHEFYLWTDKDAARGFGAYDGELFIFKETRPHLK